MIENTAPTQLGGLNAMNRMPVWLTLCAGVLFLGTSACTRILVDDFEKAIEVELLDLTQTHTYSKAIDLPSGKAELVFVARSYDCAKPINAVVEITRTTAGGTVEQKMVKLAELTWPRGTDGCRPIGYLRSANESMVRPLRFTIERGDNPVNFAVSVKETSSHEQPVVMWVVYNDRNPVDRMLREPQ
jgi:hypothetical protein